MKEQNDKITMAGILMAIIRIGILLGMLFMVAILLVTFCKAVYNIAKPVEDPNESVEEYVEMSLPVEGIDTANTSVPVATITAKSTEDIIMLPEVPEELRQINEADDVVITADTNLTYKLDGSTPYGGLIDVYTDLTNRMDISESDVRKCIAYMTSLDNNQDSIMNNETVAAAFIEASRQSGYDVLFLIALAGHESGWSVSELHQDKWNPYSIGMYDWAPEDGLQMGETFEEGIINGANYIHKYWYDEGYTSLYSMRNGGRMYASDENWMYSICSIMNSCYKVIVE